MHSNAHHLISPKKTQKEWSQNDSSCAPLGSTFHCAKGNIKVHMYVLSSQFQGCWISRIYYLCWLWLHLQNQKWCYTQINEEHGLSTASKNHIKFSKSFIGYTEISLMAELGGYMGLLLGISLIVAHKYFFEHVMLIWWFFCCWF